MNGRWSTPEAPLLVSPAPQSFHIVVSQDAGCKTHRGYQGGMTKATTIYLAPPPQSALSGRWVMASVDSYRGV